MGIPKISNKLGHFLLLNLCTTVFYFTIKKKNKKKKRHLQSIQHKPKRFQINCYNHNLRYFYTITRNLKHLKTNDLTTKINQQNTFKIWKILWSTKTKQIKIINPFAIYYLNFPWSLFFKIYLCQILKLSFKFLSNPLVELVFNKIFPKELK